MKKLVVLLTLCVAIFVGIASTTAYCSNDHGQYCLTVKTEPMNFGSIQYTPKFQWFSTTELSQKWFFPVYASKGSFSLFGGFISQWADETVGFTGVKYGTNFGNFSVCIDNNFVFNEVHVDYCNWSTVEYNTSIDGKPIYFGPQAETIRSGGETNTWWGFHAGSPDAVEVGYYYNDAYGWNIRGSVTVLIKWPSL